MNNNEGYGLSRIEASHYFNPLTCTCKVPCSSHGGHGQTIYSTQSNFLDTKQGGYRLNIVIVAHTVAVVESVLAKTSVKTASSSILLFGDMPLGVTEAFCG